MHPSPGSFRALTLCLVVVKQQHQETDTGAIHQTHSNSTSYTRTHLCACVCICACVRAHAYVSTHVCVDLCNFIRCVASLTTTTMKIPYCTVITRLPCAPPLQPHPLLPLIPSCLQVLIYSLFSSYVISQILYKWNHAVCNFSSKIFSIWYNFLGVYPECQMCLQFVPFYCQVIFGDREMPQRNHLPVEEHLDSFKLLVFKDAMHIPMRIISHFSGKK